MTVVVDQPFQILLELVQSHKLDPWDVDIERLADIFARRIREMRELDLRVSGRTLLSASVLLRIKSDYVLNGNGHEQSSEEELDEVFDLNLPELGSIMMIQRTPRKITLVDLMDALRGALKEAPTHARPSRGAMEKVVRMLNEYHINIEKYLERLHKRVAELAADGRRITMSELITERTRIAVARTLLLLLFLGVQGKVAIWQDEPLGEIFVSLLKPPGA
ncbi:MAG: segregation/condensation protein A [Candidatus Hodarchaeaceae archaeon]|nr:segregation/condensation protein A [Candidatus Hodarchaeaceae archaeon]